LLDAKWLIFRRIPDPSHAIVTMPTNKFLIYIFAYKLYYLCLQHICKSRPC
jgi:hypothetical protein